MKKVLATTLTLIFVLVLTACVANQPASTSSSAASQVQSPQVSSSLPVSSTPEVVPTSTSAQTSITDINPVDRVEALASQLYYAAMGLTEDEYGIYYGEGENFGFLMFYDPTMYRYNSYQGPLTVDGNFVTITDEEQGMTYTIELQASDEDGTLMIDTGDFGAAIMSPCEPVELVQTLDYVMSQIIEMQELASEITSAAIGVSEQGQYIYYASTETDYIMVIHNKETNEYLSFVGPGTADGNYITITDTQSGLSFTFSVEEVSEDETQLLIDTGDFGLAVLEECEAIEVVNAFISTISSSTSVN